MVFIENNSSHRKFLLVVDNNKASSSGIKTLLKQFRYKVWTVETGSEALEMSDIVVPALVILRNIDDMTHVDLIKKLKQLDPSRRLPIIVATSRKDDVDERGCLAAGAVACLKMPLNVETLYRTIQVAIEPVPRMNLRIDSRLPVVIDDETVMCSDGKFATALSESGIFLLTANPCPLKTKIPLKFKLGDKIISVDAMVIYAHKQGNQTNFKPGMGLQFVGISEQDQELIRLFIREEVRKGISISERS